MLRNLINLNKKGKLVNDKIIAGVLTVFILGILVMAGPANAFELSLIADANTVESGNKITFTANVDLSNNDKLPDEIKLVISEENFEQICSFDVTGKMKSGVNDPCYGINIKKISKNEIYGYGYGNNEQTLTYEITLHTQKIPVGEFSTELEVVTNGNVESVEGPNFTVTEKE